MIYSNKRKLSLSGWLKENDNSSYENSLKLQKFLFFYEVLSKISGEKADFKNLKGYKNGPVFSNVWGDYTKEKDNFNIEIKKAYNSYVKYINKKRAKKCNYIINSMTENELSVLTHQFNIWKSKEDRINSGEYQVKLKESDFNYNDEQLALTINKIYPDELIKNSKIIKINDKRFIISKENYKNLTKEHIEILKKLVKNEILYNPVFIELDNEGRLIID